MTLHPGCNCVEPVRSPYPIRPYALEQHFLQLMQDYHYPCLSSNQFIVQKVKNHAQCIRDGILAEFFKEISDPYRPKATAIDSPRFLSIAADALLRQRRIANF